MPAGAKVLTDCDPPRRRSGSPARRLTVLGVLPQSRFVGCSGQSRDSGSVIGFVINVPNRPLTSIPSEGLSNAESAIMFSIAPLTSLSAMIDAGRPRSGRELPPAHCIAARYRA